MKSLDHRFDNIRNASRAAYLIAGFITRTLTVEEEEELDKWVLESDENMQLFEDMTDEAMVNRFLEWTAKQDKEALLLKTKARLRLENKSRVINWWHYAAAACLLLFAAIYLGRTIRNKATPTVEEFTRNDLVPGSQVAILRMASGKTVNLDTRIDTVIGNVHISNGQVSYAGLNGDTSFHEVVIPRKGFYKLQLPDGTRVWLNSESSIRYRASFSGAEREVAVTGETFFEVAKDPSRPFIVSIGDKKIRAIGTAFNVDGFTQAITLTEGIVEVTASTGEKWKLQPGQQLTGSGKLSQADMLTVTAWTRNEFRFKDATIEEIAPLLERWYDCHVEQPGLNTYHFNGTIERDVPVSRVLQLLEETGDIHFRLKDQTITIIK